MQVYGKKKSPGASWRHCSFVRRNGVIVCALTGLFLIALCSFNVGVLWRLRDFSVGDPLGTRGALGKNGGAYGSGAVTSGRLFTGEKVREFPWSHRLYSNHQDKKDQKKKSLSWAHGRPCRKWSVTTTIFEVSEATRVQAKLPDDWCMVIVGDRKGSHKYELDEGRLGRVVYLNVAAQEAIARQGVKLAQALPWNSFGRKNLGFLYAIASGAHLIWDFDDDNMLLSSPPAIIEPSHQDETLVVEARPNTKSSTPCLSFNPMIIMGAPTLASWPRGIPLTDIKSQVCQPDSYTYSTVKVPTKRIAVYQSLANHDPDVDAIYRLTQPLPFNFSTSTSRSGEHPLMVPPTALAPFNAQATLFTYPAFFMLLLPVSVHGRVSDIWRSYAGQRLLRDLDYDIVFTPPQVVQYRNAHNYLADFESEQDLYMKSTKLVEYLTTEWNPAGTAPPDTDRGRPPKSLAGRMEQMFIELYERSYIEMEDVKLVQIWLESLIEIGYDFGSIASDISVKSMQ